MTRRRFIYVRNEETGQMEEIEISAERVIEARTEISMDRHYENLSTPEGVDIGSRRKHSAYMKARGLAMADDFKGVWAKAEQERAKAFTPGAGYDRKARREAVERAVYQHTEGKRRK